MTATSTPHTGVPIEQVRTADLLARLQRHYIKPGQGLPGGFFAAEVGVNGGYGAGQRCDAIYVGFTSSSGRLMVGHELKVSRSDWLHELARPGKADWWHDNCHEWWVVAATADLVKPVELPPGSGLMAPSTRTTTRMQKIHPAERREITPSWDAVRSVMGRQDTLRSAAVNAARKEAQDQTRSAIAAARTEFALADQSHRDGRADLVRRILARLDETRPGTWWSDINEDAVVEALSDLVHAHDQARELRWLLRDHPARWRF